MKRKKKKKFHRFASPVSMAFGDYLSTRAELSHANWLWEHSQSPDKGISRVRAGFVRLGLSDDQAAQVTALLATSDAALAHAVRAEVGVTDSSFNSRYRALTHGLVTLFSFLGFGSVPLLAYSMSGGQPFVRAIGWTVSTLFLLGIVESYATGQSILSSGLETVATGVVAAAIAYGIGKYVGEYTEEKTTKKKSKKK